MAALILEIDEGPEGVVYVHARAAAGPAPARAHHRLPLLFFIEPSPSATPLAPTEVGMGEGGGHACALQPMTVV